MVMCHRLFRSQKVIEKVGTNKINNQSRQTTLFYDIFIRKVISSTLKILYENLKMVSLYQSLSYLAFFTHVFYYLCFNVLFAMFVLFLPPA